VAKSRFAARAAQYDLEFETRRRALQEGASARIVTAVRTYLDERNAMFAANLNKTMAVLDDPGGSNMPVREVTLAPGVDPASIRRAVENAPPATALGPMNRAASDELRSVVATAKSRGGWVHNFASRLALFEDAAIQSANISDPEQKSIMSGAAVAIASTMAMSGVADEDAHDLHVIRRQMLDASRYARDLAGIETLGRMSASGNMAPIDRLIQELGERLGQAVMVGDAIYNAIGNALYAEMISRLANENHPKVLIATPAISPPVVHQSRTAHLPQQSTVAAGKHSMNDVFEDWVKKTSPKVQTQLEWQASLDMFNRIVGPVAIEDLTEDHIFAFQSVCKDLPPMRGKFDHHADLKDLARSNTGNRVSNATVNKRVTAIRTLRRHAGSQMRLTLAPVDRDSRVAPLPTPIGNSPRNPMRLEELDRVLKHPVNEGLAAQKRASTFWLLLLGTFTGARLGELLQMSIHDVIETEGVLCIALVTEDDDNAQSVDPSGKDRTNNAEKSFKTSNAIREIPVHSELLAAGFREFVEGRKQRGYHDLFEDIPLAKGRRTNKGSLLVNQHLRAAGVADVRKVYHSLRHSFRQRLESRIQKAMLNYLSGHAPGSVGERYAHGGLVGERRHAIERLDYSDLDLERIRQIARSHIL
jgi:integrase